MKFTIVALTISLLLNGCIPAAIVAGAVHHSKTKHTRQQFIKDFNATNTEREKAKLPPLDWCTSVQQFDSRWKQKECSK